MDSILIAGIGNIFLGDDGFGVEVAQRLAQRPLPEGVRVVDFGIRGLDLAYALLDDHAAVILIDATPRGEQPGTLFVLEPRVEAEVEATVEAHSLDPVKVLRLAAAMGARVRRLILVGCEPEPLESADDMRMGLSAPVQAAVGDAIVLIEGLVTKLRASQRAGAEV